MKPILPGATIGIIGGGQLGRMFTLEARRMGYRVVVLEPDADAPAVQVADHAILAPLHDRDAARRLARSCDVITLEWENADVDTVAEIEELLPVRPGAHVLRVAQHRVLEKEAARRLGLETADFHAVDSLEGLRSGLQRLGYPALLKTARGGYDGKGQIRIESLDGASDAFNALGGTGTELILEALVPFRLEASVICARTPSGEMASFPIAENIHRRGILDASLAPARLSARVLENARQVGEAMAEGLEAVGLLAVELFITDDDHVLVNEIAPRPHNSGHYTWEACAVSQFEQQLRAVCGLPLGSTELLRPAAMLNLLGEEIGTGEHLPGTAEAMRNRNLSLHLYGKREAREGRKMGHLTVLAETAEEAFLSASAAKHFLLSG
ncbi:5-(carboxyamino)imidazole ribonucleotide synthase [soil metagenome]